MKNTFFISLLLLTVSFGYSQENCAVTFAELSQKIAKEPRPIVIKMYTGWCAVCKLQDRQIDKNKDLKRLLGENYYYIEFNAESREAIRFNDKEYKFVPHGTGGIHALAAELSDAKGSYPAWIILSSDYEIQSAYYGLLKAQELITALSR